MRRGFVADPPAQVIAARLIAAEHNARSLRPGELQLHELRSLESSLYRAKTLVALINQTLSQARAMEGTHTE